MSTKFWMTRDINGYNGFGLAPPEDAKQMILTANDDQNFVVPENFAKWLVIFSFQPGTDVWVDCQGNTAQVPAGTIDDTTSELNPTARYVAGGVTISLITDDVSAEVGVALYAIE